MLFIDFEIKDEYAQAGFGVGWPYILRNYNSKKYIILGASITSGKESARYVTDLQELVYIILDHREFCMHNAQYDIGCILALFHQLEVSNSIQEKWWKESTFYDTMLMAKLINQERRSYSLEALSKDYGGRVKEKDVICNYVWESGKYQIWYKEHYRRNSKTRPEDKKLYEYGMSNLDKLPEDIVGDYCNADVNATADLYYKLQEELNTFSEPFSWNRYSELLKLCIESKRRGVRVDINKAKETRAYLEAKVQEIAKEIYEDIGMEFNLNAPHQVVEALRSIGMTGFPKTPKGNDSVAKEWMEQQGNPICKKILKFKNYTKLSRDFLTKLIDYQQIHIENNSTDFRIFPTFNIFGATATGRFSSGASNRGKKSFELNMQQIPKRGEDKEAGRYVREVFIPEEGEQWISADYSQQEQRLMVEIANRKNIESVRPLLRKYQEDPNISIYDEIARECKLERQAAKVITLGLSYCMGEAKLCRALNLPTTYRLNFKGRYVETAGEEGRRILDSYYKYMFFIKELRNIYSEKLKEEKYIVTLAGRKLYADKPKWQGAEFRDFSYKGISKMIQGSAADVTIEALLNCYKKGLKILFSVHDEINISSCNVDKDMLILEECMKNTFPLTVPMKVEITKGNSWAGD